MSIAGTVATWNRGPEFGPKWYPLSLVAIAMPCAWAGGKLLELRQARRVPGVGTGAADGDWEECDVARGGTKSSGSGRIGAKSAPFCAKAAARRCASGLAATRRSKRQTIKNIPASIERDALSEVLESLCMLYRSEMPRRLIQA